MQPSQNEKRIVMLSIGVKTYLRDYQQACGANVKPLAAYDGWQRLAAQELERRATRLLADFDNESLQAIASGELDMPTLIEQFAGA